MNRQLLVLVACMAVLGALPAMAQKTGGPGPAPSPLEKIHDCAAAPFCYAGADGEGRCIGNWICGSVGLCNADADCPAGNSCVFNSCCGSHGECAPSCTTNRCANPVTCVTFRPGCTGISACCTDGPGTESDCIEVTEADCRNAGPDGGLYLDGQLCDAILDCVPLSVELQSFVAKQIRDGVMIRWTTSTEIDTVGFRVLRQDGGREKALRVLADLIPSAGHGLVGASYDFLDNDRMNTSETQYYLEDIDVYGRVTRHGPVSVNQDGGDRTQRTGRIASER